ncbi:MAG TPA: peptidylprolyl isomerase [Pyrinomonadaceae bacterium]|nr:peptidylprolyl isomerase [Pyrinomonadaceae bacterium]
MSHLILRLSFLTVTVLFLAPPLFAQRTRAPREVTAGIDPIILLQIIRAEDTRRWDGDLEKLIAHDDPKIRKRALLAVGRIGNEGAVPLLAERVLTDRDVDVRQMAAFALGEIESGGGAYALTQVLKTDGVQTAPAEVRARAVEALGKIIAAVTSPGAAKPDDDWLDIAKAPIVNTLRFELGRGAQANRLTILLALTAVLRAKPDGAGKLLAQCLDHQDSRIVADALNTLARLRLKDGNDKARELLKHNDPIVRANAARLLGAIEDKQAFDALLDRALHDSDSRVGISALRSLASLKDARAVQPLLERGEYLLKLEKVSGQFAIEPRNELLEIVTVLGRLLPNSNNQTAIDFLKRLRQLTDSNAVEVEVAFARVAPQQYVTELNSARKNTASLASGLSEIATIETGMAIVDIGNKEAARDYIYRALSCPPAQPRRRIAPLRVPPGTLLGGQRCTPVQNISISGFLRAYAAFKPEDLQKTISSRLLHQDVIVRATAAELLGEQPPGEANTRALIDALPVAMRDADNDAALAILGALAKQKNKEANDAIKTALDAKDHLLRRRAASLLKANAVGDFSDRIGTVQTKNTEADYRRAIARIGKKPTATVVTSKGSFTIEFLPEDAPLNVDNFLQLAKRGYFNGQTVPRVVANFVVQAGDPRGDQNGGPGYSIRCEVNEVPYERASVGMALSGKDTGGSQWFVTHSPQPHLDGGYTVFGRVIRGMEVVDRIARGDRIVRVVVNER